MEPLVKAVELKRTLDSLRPIDKEKEAIIMQKFRLDWNYNSNNLEGNSLTFGETKALILFGITAQGKPLKDHFEITGHDQAIKWVSDVVKGDYPLTENFIRELHTLLLKSPYDVDAITSDGQPTQRRISVGQYKTTPNHVLTETGEIFRFATPEETPPLMHDLLDWYRAKIEEPDFDPIILAAEFHYKFIRIHPFDDGNGRTARILMNFILMRFGYPPVIIKTEDKENYFSALQQADAGIIKPFFDYIATNLIRSLEIMIAGAKGESIEEPDDIDKEIALLKQRLKANGKDKSENLRTKEVLLGLYDDSFSRLWNQFLVMSKKFDGFYLTNEVYLGTNTKGKWGIDALDEIRSYLSDSTNFIEIQNAFRIFLAPGYGEFDHSPYLKMELSYDEGYSVSVDNQGPIFTKKYGEQLTDDEIKNITNQLARNHKNFIDKKIKEAETSK